MAVSVCKRGHTKVTRPGGYLVCPTCETELRRQRSARLYEHGSLAGTRRPRKLALPTGDFCPRGHPREAVPGKPPRCQTCQNIWRKGRRDLARRGVCYHLDEPGFDALLNTEDRLVCLTCLATEMA